MWDCLQGKTKAEKKRQAVADAFLKTTHQHRQEAAQARREEKTRERKQRLMEEEDPEKQRRLEVGIEGDIALWESRHCRRWNRNATRRPSSRR
jgi:hypothetical protein